MLANGDRRLAGKPVARDHLLVAMMRRRNTAGVNGQHAGAHDQRHHNRNRNACRPAHVAPVGIRCSFARPEREKQRPPSLAAEGPALYARGMGTLTRTLALVGMMGAGKSSIGRRLAARLDVRFCDADVEIEAAAGCPISEIFERFGEAEFRNGERRVIIRLLNEQPHVLATGGGALLDPKTRAQIAKRAFSIWLRAPVELLLSRIERRDTRPLLRQGNPRETLERLLREREPLYAQADLVVDAIDAPHGTAVERILSALKKQEILAA